MFCSTIIPTIGRPSLARAVNSVLSQELTGAEFEIIVVNDSGRPLPEAGWQQSSYVQVLATDRRNRSVARNAGAAIARGTYLHFLDDDDWLLPGALQAFHQVAVDDETAWLAADFRLVDNSGNLIAIVCPSVDDNCFIQLIASEWLPLQASLISAETFFKVGGFASLPSLLGGYEDIDLSRLIVRFHNVARVHEEVAAIRTGDRDSTTNYANLNNQNRQSREKALNMPGAFGRMWESVQGAQSRQAYWQGRLIYYYLASLWWNLRQKRGFLAVSRLTFASAAIAVTGRHLFSPGFWRALSTPHINQVREVQERSGANLFSNTVWVD